MGMMGCQAIPLGKISDDQVVTGEFPAVWIGQINYAYKDFLKAGYDRNCFIVKLVDGDGKRTISIFATDHIERVDGKTIIHFGGVTPCGRGANYHFDASGKFIRKTYNR
jgi:hypothetical protein